MSIVPSLLYAGLLATLAAAAIHVVRRARRERISLRRALIEFLTPPQIADEQASNLAGLVVRIARGTLALGLLLTLAVIPFSPPDERPAILVLGAATTALMLLAILLVHRRWVRPVVAAFPLALWAVVSDAIIAFPAASNPALVAYIPVILIAGLLHGFGAGVFFALLSSLTVAGIYYADELGLSRASLLADLDARSWLVYVAFFGASALLARRVLSNMGEGAERSRQLLGAERKRAHQMEALAEVGRRLTGQADPSRVMGEVVEYLISKFNYDHASLLLIRGDELYIDRTVGTYSGLIKVGDTIPLGRGIIGWVAQTGQAYWTNDASTDEHFVPLPGAHTLSELAVPLRLEKSVIGVLNIDSERAGMFDETDVDTLESLADLLTTALQSAQLLTEVLNRERAAQALQRAGAAVAASLDLDTVLQTMCREARAAFDADGAGVWFVVDDRLRAMAGDGDGLEQALVSEIPLGDQQTPAAQVAREGRALILHDLGDDSACAVLLAPIRSESQVLGVLMIVDRMRLQRFGPGDIDTAMLLSAQLATAVRNAQLFRQAQQQTERLQALNEVARAVSAQLDLDAVLEVVYRQAERVLPLDAFIVCLYAAETQTCTYPLVYDEGQRYDQEPTALIPNTHLHRAIISGQPALINRTAAEVEGAQRVLDERGLGNFDKASASLLYAPLVVGGTVLGAVTAQCYRLNAYLPEHLQLLQGVTQHASIAIGNARLFAATQARSAEMEVLYQASLALTSRLELQPLLEAILIHALKLVGAQDAHIFLYDGQHLKFGAAKWADGRSATPYTEPRESGLTYHVARTGELAAISDVNGHPLFANWKWGGAIIGLPLRVGEQVRGVMNIAFDQPRRFESSELRVLGLLADQAAIALENARLHAEMKDNVRELHALLEANTNLLSTLDIDPLLHNVLTGAISAVPAAEKGSIVLVEPETQQLRIRAAHGYSDRRVIEHGYAPFSGYVAKAVREDLALLITDVWTESAVRYDGGIPEIQDVRSAIVAPLKVEGQLLGAISLDSSRLGAFTAADLRLLQTFARSAGVAIGNAGDYAQTKAQAVTDSLTGLANRRAFDYTLEHEVTRAIRYGNSLALIILDIDEFKQFNDTHGHLAGDERLKEIAGLLSGKLREPDLAARYGGEEFAVVMPHTNKAGALVLAERLRAAAAAAAPTLPRTNEPVAGYTLSLGVAVYPDDARNARDLLLAADNAELAAKRQGKNRVVAAGDSAVAAS